MALTTSGLGFGNWGSLGYGAAKVTTTWFGGTYALSPSFDVSTAYYNINNAAIAVKGDGQYTIAAYSVLADYHFSKMSDAYAGLMSLNYSGDYMTAHSTLATSNAIYGAGLRVRF